MLKVSGLEALAAKDVAAVVLANELEWAATQGPGAPGREPVPGFGAGGTSVEVETEDPTAPEGEETDFRRAVFCGAQAAVIGFGQKSQSTKMSWVEELFDYENQLGVAAGMIFGIKKTVFNSVDFGTIVLSGYAPSP